MSKYTKEKLEQLIPSCKSMADICRHFGVKPATGTQSYLSRKIHEYGIDTSHFTGQGWNKGKTFPPQSPIESYLNGTIQIASHKLKLRLIKEGLKEAKCEKCGIDKWLGEDVVLELDHIDSNHTNNNLVNLQILCPNCHALETRLRKQKSPCGQTGKVVRFRL